MLNTSTPTRSYKSYGYMEYDDAESEVRGRRRHRDLAASVTSDMTDEKSTPESERDLGEEDGNAPYYRSDDARTERTDSWPGMHRPASYRYSDEDIVYSTVHHSSPPKMPAPKPAVDYLKMLADPFPEELVHTHWNTFHEHISQHKGVANPLEVLIGEPGPRLKATAHRKNTVRAIEAAKTGKAEANVDHFPERIIITSNTIMEILRTFNIPLYKPYKGSGVAFLRPFRTFVYYEKEIREWAERLEDKFAPMLHSKQQGSSSDDHTDHTRDDTETPAARLSVENMEEHDKATKKNYADTSHHHRRTVRFEEIEPGRLASHRVLISPSSYYGNSNNFNIDPDSGPDDGNEDSHEGTKSPKALVKLRSLLLFMDTDLRQRIEFLKSPECHKISFHDIWHLFKPGDEVIDQNEKQAYRVTRVYIPEHRIVSPLPELFKTSNMQEEKNTWRGDREEVHTTYSHDSNNNEKSTNMYAKLKNDRWEQTPRARIHCVYIDFDGENFGPVNHAFDIRQFDGDKSVTALPVYPFRFSKKANLRESLVSRGRMLWDIIRVKPMYYRGPTMDTHHDVDSQVIIDFSEAISRSPMAKSRKAQVELADNSLSEEDARDRLNSCDAECCSSFTVYHDYSIDDKMCEHFIWKSIPDNAYQARPLILYPRPLKDMLDPYSEPTVDEFVVMTHRAFGFVLRNRKWAQLDLTYLRYEKASHSIDVSNAFKSLVLPDGHKDMLKSLVLQHFRDKVARDRLIARNEAEDVKVDLIRGKGRGLIILLHGPPGVGKTTTAEGIAEEYKRPLFQVTCGDLGTTAQEVEKNLELNFALASRWNCILLLDEADVFLASRERKDFIRNGLVAVFLRVLEYYTGILFLTTNRVGDFDEAFASRIHMSLYYPKLDLDKTARIFQVNLDLIKERYRLQGRQGRLILDDGALVEFAKKHFLDNEAVEKRGLRWNGRQIRNAVQTALAMAEYEAQGNQSMEVEDKLVTLKLSHFQTIEKAYDNFSVYLGNVFGMDWDERAAEARTRAEIAEQEKKSKRMAEQPRQQHQGKSTMMERLGSFQEQNRRPEERMPSMAAQGSPGLSYQAPAYGMPVNPGIPMHYNGQSNGSGAKGMGGYRTYQQVNAPQMPPASRPMPQTPVQQHMPLPQQFGQQPQPQQLVQENGRWGIQSQRMSP